MGSTSSPTLSPFPAQPLPSLNTDRSPGNLMTVIIAKTIRGLPFEEIVRADVIVVIEDNRFAVIKNRFSEVPGSSNSQIWRPLEHLPTYLMWSVRESLKTV